MKSKFKQVEEVQRNLPPYSNDEEGSFDVSYDYTPGGDNEESTDTNILCGVCGPEIILANGTEYANVGSHGIWRTP